MSQMPGDIGSYILAGHSPEEAARLSAEYQKKYGDKFSPPPPPDKKTMEGAPLPTNDPTNPESQFEYLLGIRMTKKQKWAVVIGGTLALWALLIYSNKKK
jgi:hypothetical protein